MGMPTDPKVWSNAPANLIDALTRQGYQIHPIDSSPHDRVTKAGLALRSFLAGHRMKSHDRLSPTRRWRAKHVAADGAGCSFILCTSTMDAPVGQGIPYAIWMDNTWNLLCKGRGRPALPQRTLAEIERLERRAIIEADCVMAFSDYVREDLITSYGVSPDRVFTVGCGAGALPAFTGTKSYQEGHLLFAAKRAFSDKGGDIVLDAFRIIRRQRPRTELVVIGSDEALQKAAGIEGITAHGYLAREDLIQCFHGASMLVEPVLVDAWGQVFMEAMKARAIVVAMDEASLPELTDGGRLAVLVREPTAEAIANAVLATYQRSEADLSAIADEAQELVLAKHNWDAVAARVISALTACDLLKPTLQE